MSLRSLLAGILLLWVALACLEATDTEALPSITFQDTTLRVGEASGDFAFGLISDATWFGRDILLLDEQAPSIVWVSEDGEVLQRIATEGDGPGDLGQPVAIDVSGSQIAVLDQERMAVLRFSMTDSIEYVDEFRLRAAPVYDLCILGNQILVNAPQGGNSVHVYDLDGNHVKAFQAAADLDTKGIERRWEESILASLGQGRLACREPDQLLFLPQFSPVVTAVDVETAQHEWTLELEDYQQVQWAARDGGLRYSPDPEIGWFHAGTGVTQLDDNLILVQLLRFGPEASTSITADPQEYRVLQVRDTIQRQFRDTVPRIVDYHDGATLHVSAHPFPQLTRVSIEVSSEN